VPLVPLTLSSRKSSGIGGGAFMVHYDKQTQTFDGRETAP
jgi:gamma-glutamyltranspeptidase/glutathione hydrolase